MKTILVPTDFSPVARHAITSAATLVAKAEGQLIILHVIEDAEDSGEMEKQRESIFRIAALQDLNYHYKQTTGDPIDVIADQQVDLIVMGSKGASGLKNFFIGTHTEKVARLAKCPVITVKQHTDLASVHSIVYPTDMRTEQEEVVRHIKALQRFYQAHLHLLKVYHDGMVLEKDVKKRLNDFAEFFHLENYSVTARAGADEADEIMAFAHEINAGMIAMATHDHHGLDKLLSGHISGDVINKGHLPIWTLSIF